MKKEKEKIIIEHCSEIRCGDCNLKAYEKGCSDSDMLWKAKIGRTKEEINNLVPYKTTDGYKIAQKHILKIINKEI